MDQEQRETDTNQAAIDLWCKTLGEFRQLDEDENLRKKQLNVMAKIKEDQLEPIQDEQSLVAHYRAVESTAASMAISRESYPDGYRDLRMYQVIPASYGVRYIELMTGKTIDPRKPLPEWLGEWTSP